MSTIEKIKIKNFKCFGAETFELKFNAGVNIIVGKNEEGKSTILEAIHLALTSSYRGRNIKNALSQDLFNAESVSEYLREINNGIKNPPPEMLIELWISNDNDTVKYEGNGNSEDKNGVSGIKLHIKLDEEQKQEYYDLLNEGELLSLPLEYYSVDWESFSRQKLNAHSQKIKSVLIDSSNFHFQNAPDIFISHIVKDVIADSDKRKVVQACRQAKESFGKNRAIEILNDKIKQKVKSVSGNVALDVTWGGVNDWEKYVTLKIEDVPFHQQGRGNQCIVKTELALAHERAREAPFLLLEEPESHLTFAKMNQLISCLSVIASNKQIFITTHSSFVANKLGLDNLILLRKKEILKFEDLSIDTYEYFKKISGYDTLRLLLADRCILVEGDADELVVQKAYKQKCSTTHIEDGVDIISVHTSFLRYLEIASKLKIKLAVVTDNDGDIQALEEKYADYIKANKKEGILISYSPFVCKTFTKIKDKEYNDNTLEPELIRANKRSVLEYILAKRLKRSFFSEPDMLKLAENDCETDREDEWNANMRVLMKNNKVDAALCFFETDVKFEIPKYIMNAIAFIHEA